jgi:hypothetical protein
MLHFKSMKCCLGIVLPLGLVGCLEMHGGQPMEPSRYPRQVHSQYQQAEASSTSKKPAAKQKTYASKDPTQKSTPGPSRKAAPQLPVIQ